MRNGNVVLSPTELEAFKTDYGNERSFRADYANATCMVLALLTRMAQESEDYKAKRDSAHLWKPHADALSVFVEKYEAEHMAIPEANLAAVLKYFMNEHDLRQTDLPEIGSQGVVSEVLAGKRELNTRQITGLAKCFGVSPAVFL